MLLGAHLSDNLHHIERRGEGTRTHTGDTSGNEVLPESETTILLFTHGVVMNEENEILPHGNDGARRNTERFNTVVDSSLRGVQHSCVVDPTIGRTRF